ncbi:hypothetical protein [Mariniflexile sp. AS56]|uniref:hypothetical protein n=1 Tax=Mariniflexile sp. AS56 TaxID=3063957 RepID=UPI0026E9E77F|nr:hypothetical protein [Mariniflexile sp. AS56]MDO7173602.1 hypothetical protein [Mariniflexile sp. AS56]
MNKLLAILLISLAVLNCNGGKTKKDTLKTSVEKFKDSIGALEIVKNFPETYSETLTDTILSNGFKVKIKTYANMESSVLNRFKVDTITHKHFYRDFISEITVYKNDEKILSESINKTFSLKYNNELKDYFEIATLAGVWINDNEALTADQASIYIMYTQPETDNYYLSEMIINSDGTFVVQDIEG